MNALLGSIGEPEDATGAEESSDTSDAEEDLSGRLEGMHLASGTKYCGAHLDELKGHP